MLGITSLTFSLLTAMGPAGSGAVDVTVDTAEPEAVLTILDARSTSSAVSDEMWARLFATEGYRRLKEREASMKRGFEDAEFREFVLAEELLARRQELRRTLDKWSRVDPTEAAGRALHYLPEGSKLRATVYPVIKPRSNSFVFDLASDPAIFFYLDPSRSDAVFENTMAHELHHVGYSAACGDPPPGADERVDFVKQWIGAFGEGLAMLAAAGGPDVHPHAESPAEDRERWDRDVAGFDGDLKKVEAFFLDVLDGKLVTEDERNQVAFSFFGVQGPWYTVGWKMAVTIEKQLGRDRLIAVSCDPVEFLSTYNEAAGSAGTSMARWSESFLNRLRQEGTVHRLAASPDTVAWGYYWAQAKPVLRVASGDVVDVDTMITSSPPRLEGAGLPPEKVPQALRDIYDHVTDKGPGGHILTGPIFVEGAEPGDVLEVRILSIELPVDYGYNGCRGFLPENCEENGMRLFELDRERMSSTFAPGIEIPLKPFFGSLGVAPPPSAGRISSNPPGIHAGNLDNQELVAGTTLYIPVHVEGALFEVGDGHAAQGDGEVDQTAIETFLRGRLQLVVRKDLHLEWPRAETKTHWIAMGMDEDLTVATRIAVQQAVDFLVATRELDKMEAYRLVSIACDVRITELVDGNVGVHVMIPKSIFSDATSHD